MSLFYKFPYRPHGPNPFPRLEKAGGDGLLCMGGELEPSLVLEAYSRGIFPWPQEDCPLFWFSPDPRCILFPADFHISSRSQRKIRSSGFTITFNKAFDKVISACAAPRARFGGTWILPEVISAYGKLFQAGYCQSVEVWQKEELVGGLYGVCMGRAFFGESMFHHVSEASRAALQALVIEAIRLDFVFIDCQQASRHMLAMGAQMVSRKRFQELLVRAFQPDVD